MANPMNLTSNYTLEPKRNNLFTLEIIDVPGNGTDTVDKLQLDLTNASRPQFTYEVAELHRLNMKYKVATKPGFGHTLSVTFRDTIEQNTGKILYDWNQVIFNRANGAMGYATGYKTNGNLYILDPRGITLEKWEFLGMFPSDTNYGDLAYEGSTHLTIACTFTYDLAKLVESNTPSEARTYGTPQTEVQAPTDDTVEVPNTDDLT